MEAYAVGNYNNFSVSNGITKDVSVSLDATVHTKEVSVKCDTYLNKAFVKEATFKSVFTAAEGDVAATNVLTIASDAAYDTYACDFSKLTIVGATKVEDIPKGTTVTATLFKDYATEKTEKEEAKEGGVVVKFKSDKAYTTADYFSVDLLSPVVTFTNKDATAACTIAPEAAGFDVTPSASRLGFSATLEAGKEYVVTCPNTKATVNIEKSKYALYDTSVGVVVEDKTVFYATEPKSANSASFATIVGSVVLAASALAALL